MMTGEQQQPASEPDVVGPTLVVSMLSALTSLLAIALLRQRAGMNVLVLYAAMVVTFAQIGLASLLVRMVIRRHFTVARLIQVTALIAVVLAGYKWIMIL